MSWPTARLDECARVVGGATPSTTVAANWDGQIKWVTPKDLSDLNAIYIEDTPRKITEVGLASCAAEVLPAYSVLFSSRAPIGHVAINTEPMATNQGFKSFVPKPDRLTAGYLYWWLKANRPYLESLGNGATFKEVSKSVVSRVEIPLPPLDEQKRIAAILDQADALRQKRREAVRALLRLPLSIFDSMFGDPVTNPNGLKRQPLGDLAEFISGGTPNKSQADLWGGNFPWISPKDMKQLRIFGASDFITDKAFKASSLKKVRAGTPLIVVRGMILAHTIPIAITSRELAINQDMKAIAFNGSVIPEFGLWCMKAQHDSILSKVDTAAHGTKRLDTDRLRSIPIFTVSTDEQRRFLVRIKQWERMVNDCEEQTAKLDVLFSSLQHRAFRGEL